LGTCEYAVTAYWNKPEETAECFLKIEDETWYRTKDIVRVNEDGLLFYLDRRSKVGKMLRREIRAEERRKLSG
jgi:acyl-CoA synthetase (AMP-forming)/AMP-acid ligase II